MDWYWCQHNSIWLSGDGLSLRGQWWHAHKPPHRPRLPCLCMFALAWAVGYILYLDWLLWVWVLSHTIFVWCSHSCPQPEKHYGDNDPQYENERVDVQFHIVLMARWLWTEKTEALSLSLCSLNPFFCSLCNSVWTGMISNSKCIALYGTMSHTHSLWLNFDWCTAA